MMRLVGKVAMVTGSGGEHGLGRAIAKRLASDGVDLVLTDVEPCGANGLLTKPPTAWGGLDAVAAEIRAMGRRALTAVLDIRSARQIDEVVHQALEHFGRLDILVNNAAAPPGADRVPVVDVTEEAWDAVLNVNLKGSFLCSKAVAAVMLRQKTQGRIVNIASDRGKEGAANLAAYCASKFGLIGFTQSLALELAPAGITVNALCPGGMDTERLDYLGKREDGGYDAELRAARVRERAAKVPTGRYTPVVDVAETVAFLVSDAASQITAQAINVSGGTILH